MAREHDFSVTVELRLGLDQLRRGQGNLDRQLDKILNDQLQRERRFNTSRLQGQQQLHAQIERLSNTEIQQGRRLSTTKLRELQRSNRELTREHERAARDAAGVYEKHLSRSFFAKIGRGAADGFKSTFRIGAGGGVGGGGILSGAASVLSGNLLTSLLGGVTSQITGGVKAGFDYNKLKEQTLLGFEIKLKGREQAEAFFRQIEAFAEKAPMGLDAALESTQQLMSAFTAPQALQSLKAITDAVANQGKVGGEAAERINGIGLALQQILFKNKLQAEELVQLQERQIDPLKYIVAEVEKVDASLARMSEDEKRGAVAEMISKGLINARAAVAAIIRGLEKDFGGTAEKIATRTAAGLESNISDSLNRTAGIASESAFEQYKKFLVRTNEFLQTGAAEKIAGGISGSSGALFGALEKTLGAVQSGSIQQLGLDVPLGYASGIMQGIPQAAEAGANMVKGALKSVADAQQSNSPSLVFMQLGEDAAAGYHLGFQKGMGRVSGNVGRYDDLIEKAAAQYGLDPNLIRAMMQQESGGKKGAVSHKGASGLMQLMPATARRFGVSDIFDPEQNIMGGARYMRFLLDRFGGDTRLALAGYNAGEGAVDKYKGRIPPYAETQNYVRSIMANYGALTQSGGTTAPPATVDNPVPVVLVNSGLNGLSYEEQVKALGGLPGFSDYYKKYWEPMAPGQGVGRFADPEPFTDPMARHIESLGFGGTFTPRDARQLIVDEIYKAREGAVKAQEMPLLGIEDLRSQAFASVKLIVEETGDAFGGIPAIINKSTKESKRDLQELARDVSGMFGGLLQATVRGRWRDGLRGLLDDVQNFFISRLQESFEKRFMSWLSGASGGGASSGSGGGLFSSIGGFFKGIFGGGGASATTPPFAGGSIPGLSFSGGGAGGGFDLDRLDAPQTTAEAARQVATDRAIASVGKGATKAATGSGLKALGSTFAASLPDLAISYGISSWAGALQGNLGDFQAITGAGLVGFLINRTLRRRREEKVRNEISHDTGTAIWGLIAEAQGGRMGLAEARQRFNDIKARYYEAIGQIKDGKTAKNARLQFENDFQPLLKTLETIAQQNEDAAARSERLIPAFFSGGSISARFADGGATSSFIGRHLGRVPGYFDKKDDRLVAVSGNEVILTPDQWQPIAPYLKAKNVPGFQSGGSVSPAPSAPPPSDGTLVIDSLQVNIDRDGMAQVIIESNYFKKAVIKNVKVGVRHREL